MNRKEKAKRKKHRRQLAHNQVTSRHLDLGFASMEQHGRVIQQVSHGDTPEAAIARADLLDRRPAIEQEMHDRKVELIDVLKSNDALNILGQVMFVYSKYDDMPTERERSIRNLAHVEYLALLIMSLDVSVAPQSVDPNEENAAISSVLELLPELFRLKMLLMTLDEVADDKGGGEADAEAFRAKTRRESLIVRGTSYKSHHERLLHGCLDDFDNECRRICGFTASEAIVLYEGMATLVIDRFAQRAQEARSGAHVLLERLNAGATDSSKRNGLPDWAFSQSARERREAAMNLSGLYLFHDFRKLILMTSEELATHTNVDAEVCSSFLDAFVCDPASYQDDYHGMPVGGHPLTQKPILKIDNNYALPVPSVFLDVIRPVMEDRLQAADPATWDRYLRHRSDFAGQESCRIMTDALPGAVAWDAGMKWKSVDDDSDLDALVRIDDAAIRFQCKGGRLSASARRGSIDRMKTNINSLVTDAVRQHEALSKALTQQKPVELGFDADQQDALLCPIQIEMVVCLDDLTVWATEAHELGPLGLLPSKYPVPLVISLTDLMAVGDLLNGAQLIHYFIRRLRLEHDGRISAHDELDWLGHYLQEGLFFDRYFEVDEEGEQLDGMRLGTYTDAIDAWYFDQALKTGRVKKPEHKLRGALGTLVGRLENQQPIHWLSAALALIDGDDESQRLWAKSIRHVNQTARNTGWSNASQVFNGRFGITYFVDRRIPGDDIEVALEDFCDQKRGDTDEKLWLAVGAGSDLRLQAVVDGDAFQSALTSFVPGTRPPGDEQKNQTLSATPD